MVFSLKEVNIRKNMNKIFDKVPKKESVLGIFLGLALWLLVGPYLGYMVVGSVLGLAVALIFILGFGGKKE